MGHCFREKLDNVPDDYHRTIRSILKKNSHIWDGHLGEIKATKHRIELIPGARPVRSAPYRQGLKGREFERKTVAKLLREGAIFLSESEYASTVVIVKNHKPEHYVSASTSASSMR